MSDQDPSNEILTEGPSGSVLVAQATPGAFGEPIGTVETLAGKIIITRVDGTQIQATKGLAVYQGDTVETGEISQVGITFADNSTFALSGGGEMVLDEMVYDPDAQSGSMNLNVVEGVFSFVSGQIAKTGPDAMTITTPVATIGVRGSTGAGKHKETTFLSLLRDPNGEVGQLIMNGQDLSQEGATSQATNRHLPGKTPVILSQKMIDQFYGNVANVAKSQASQAQGNQGGGNQQQQGGQDQTGDTGSPTGGPQGPQGPTDQQGTPQDTGQQGPTQQIEQSIEVGLAVGDAVFNEAVANGVPIDVAFEAAFDASLQATSMAAAGMFNTGPGTELDTDAIAQEYAGQTMDQWAGGGDGVNLGGQGSVGGQSGNQGNQGANTGQGTGQGTGFDFDGDQDDDDEIELPDFFTPGPDDDGPIFGGGTGDDDDDDDDDVPFFGDPAAGVSVSASALATSTFAAFSGVTITGGTASFTGNVFTGTESAVSLSSTSLGTVSGVNYSLGEGILITNGDGTPPNTNTSTFYRKGASGQADSDLTALAGTATKDTSTLSFNFTLTDTDVKGLVFQWMFGSEEYPDQGVTDIAGVWVDGTNYLTFNQDDSTVKFVDGTNEAFFLDNSSSSLAIEYDGVTRPSYMLGVLDTRLSTHTIKIGVGDTSDDVFDSGLYISSVGVAKDSSNASSSDDILMGGSGNDSIQGQAGDDILFGQGGSDIFQFGGLGTSASTLGVDTLVDFSGSVAFKGGSGDSDTIKVDSSTLGISSISYEEVSWDGTATALNLTTNGATVVVLTGSSGTLANAATALAAGDGTATNALILFRDSADGDLLTMAHTDNLAGNGTENVLAEFDSITQDSEVTNLSSSDFGTYTTALD